MHEKKKHELTNWHVWERENIKSNITTLLLIMRNAR